MKYFAAIRSYLDNRSCRIAVLLVLFFIMPICPASGAESPMLQQLKQHEASVRGENLQVANILRAIARQSAINIFVADNIDSKITLEMENLTLYDIFHVIMNAKRLRSYEKNKVLYVVKESDFQEELQDVKTETLCTKFSDAADYVDQIKPLMTSNGTVSLSKRTNCFIVRDREPNIARIKQVIEKLDTPIPQIHIEARIVSVSQEAKKRLGVRWGYDNLSNRNPVTADVDLSIIGSTNVAVGFIRDNLDLSVDLMALQEENMLNILSAPRVLVVDGREAEIKQGKEVPFVTQSGDLINTSFREANLSLRVTPKIMRDKYIVLDVNVTNDSVDQTLVGTEPLINKQEIKTNLILEDGVTVVIGGILLQTKDNQKGSVPWISKIPLLGYLFRNSLKSNEQSELMVFLTPTIVNIAQIAVNPEDLEGSSDFETQSFNLNANESEDNLANPATAAFAN